MATEIELKYLVNDTNVVEKITELLTSKQIAFQHQPMELSNCYFDTQALDFRQHDFGLRVRTRDGKREQTIKTAGQAIGGLHKRPEYNVDIEENFPDLTRFPQDIWPVNVSVDNWQSSLIVLFSTDFTRHTWTLDYQQSTIELAFDQGNVSSAGQSIELCEIELELLTGNEADIFALAEQLMAVLMLRPGTQSKAARGYRLWHNTQISEPEHFPTIPTLPYFSVAETFIKGLSFSLNHLQKSVDYYFYHPKLADFSRVHHALLLIRHGLWLFDELAHDEICRIRKEVSYFLKLFAWQNNAKNVYELIAHSNTYRKKIEYNQALIEQLKLEKMRFPTAEQIQEILQSQRFNTLQLSLLTLVLKGEEQFADDQNSADDLFVFAQKKLEISLQDIEQEMPVEQYLSAEQYLSQQQNLTRSLLTGSWLGRVFDDNARHEYRAPWLDIMQGITELATLAMLRQQLVQLQASDAKNEKLLMWLDSKIETLLHALDTSRQIALKVLPYWRA